MPAYLPMTPPLADSGNPHPGTIIASVEPWGLAKTTRLRGRRRFEKEKVKRNGRQTGRCEVDRVLTLDCTRRNFAILQPSSNLALHLANLGSHSINGDHATFRRDETARIEK